ncbi:MAG TPA: reverse transcriptase domain-containing protein, partial [Nitrospiria bacterium]|nr:reverse transcriptase domain-containing protein [Nitrospiria bacterium]
MPQRHFKMETLKQVCTMINQGDYLTSIDLTDAFMHVLVHQSSRRFLQFTWKGRLFQFRVLPFGMSLSPMVFTKILKPVLRWARRKGIRLTAYLDDLLIVAKDRATSLRRTELVLHKLADLGFPIKRSKSSLIPSQSIQHLGFTINTTNLSLTVPTSKIRNLRREASRLLRRPTSTIRALASFIGKSQSMTIAIFPARLKTRHLLLCKNMALHQTKSWTSPLSLSPAAKDELMWWKEQLLSWNGQSFLPSSPQVEIYTDASDSGWGIV